MKLYKLWKDMQNIIKRERSHNFKKVFQVLSLSRFITSLSTQMACLLWMPTFFTNISYTTIDRRQSEGGVECDEKKLPGMINTFLLFWLCFQGISVGRPLELGIKGLKTWHCNRTFGIRHNIEFGIRPLEIGIINFVS